MKYPALTATCALIASISTVQADEQIAVVVAATQSPVVEKQVDAAPLEAPSQAARAGTSVSGYLAKVRKKESLQDFRQKMSRNYPKNYAMLAQLDLNSQEAVYQRYLEGARLRTIRKDVISRYAYRQKN